MIPSPKVPTYDMKPEMSAHELTDQLVNAILANKYDAIICNYANADMVGHTGNIDAAILAIETIDQCLRRVLDALNAVQGEMLVTADHGNAELMKNQESKQPHTAHTSYPVPLIYVGRQASVLVEDGTLSDIAPTFLSIMGLDIPKEMTGRRIFEVMKNR